ncbi:hypothetical protein [Burkholderia latens]|uniref:hypothetical protein n=1 Tax=Burkholderia latens TaxID=488446 RepID=UPI001AE3879B|nr:hypothetical protein [Burkholderia latens]QTO51901.1 hypothetical protein J8I86_27475 [Burkholderia latens]
MSLSAELARLDDELASQRERERVSIAAVGAARYRRLLALDYISTDRLQQRQADPFDQQSKLLGLQRDRRTISQALKEAGNGLSGLALGHQNPLPQTRRRT